MTSIAPGLINPANLSATFPPMLEKKPIEPQRRKGREDRKEIQRVKRSRFPLFNFFASFALFASLWFNRFP
jgi:hypothetical protein